MPFFATSYSLGDVVYVQEEGGELVVKDLVSESGNSTLQIVVFQPSETDVVLQKLEALGCDWEGSHIPDYFSINVPEPTDYLPIKEYLTELSTKEVLGYREACLAHCS